MTVFVESIGHFQFLIGYLETLYWGKQLVSYIFYTTSTILIVYSFSIFLFVTLYMYQNKRISYHTHLFLCYEFLFLV